MASRKQVKGILHLSFYPEVFEKLFTGGWVVFLIPVLTILNDLTSPLHTIKGKHHLHKSKTLVVCCKALSCRCLAHVFVRIVSMLEHSETHNRFAQPQKQYSPVCAAWELISPAGTRVSLFSL